MVSSPINKLDPIESALVNLHEAKQAGVFESTRLDLDALLATPPAVNRPSWLTSRSVGAVAAVLACAVGISGWMFSRQLNQLRTDRDAHLVVTLPAASSPSIAACLNGPLTGDLNGCRAFDLDGDGDVDLADFSSYQLASAKGS